MNHRRIEQNWHFRKFLFCRQFLAGSTSTSGPGPRDKEITARETLLRCNGMYGMYGMYCRRHRAPRPKNRATNKITTCLRSIHRSHTWGLGPKHPCVYNTQGFSISLHMLLPTGGNSQLEASPYTAQSPYYLEINHRKSSSNEFESWKKSVGDICDALALTRLVIYKIDTLNDFEFFVCNIF